MGTDDAPAPRHRAAAPACVRCALLTVSDTRTRETDRGGQLLADLLTAAGHAIVERQLVTDYEPQIRARVASLAHRDDVDALLVTGGTGISPRDHTCDAVSSLLEQTLPGYGELFRLLSYREIGPAAMLSRTIGGLLSRTIVLTIPGSPSAVRMAMEQLILPELGHLVQQADKHKGT